jgi:hypothetical protein
MRIKSLTAQRYKQIPFADFLAIGRHTNERGWRCYVRTRNQAN